MASSSEERDLLVRIREAVEFLDRLVNRLNNSSRRLEYFTALLLTATALLVLTAVMTLTLQYPGNPFAVGVALVVDLATAAIVLGSLWQSRKY